MISKDLTIKELIKMNKAFIDVFANHGFKGLDNKLVLSQIGDYKLEAILKQKGKNVDIFIELLEEVQKDQVVDITLEESNNKGNINVLGLLPCPVRIPLLEALQEIKGAKSVNFNLKAASEGLDWLKESVANAKTEDDLSDIYISAGFDLFFELGLMKQYKDKKVFSDYMPNRAYNKDFDNDYLSLRDPNHDYSMIGVVPAVFLVNKSVLGDRPIPRTWEDIFDPIYEGSISLPVSDFDLFNAIMLHIYKEFGPAYINKLSKQLIASMHPSEMVKSDRQSRVKPAISIMPYFFTKMALPGSVMQAVWPEDGAIISPIFMLSKTNKQQILKPITDFFFSKEVGEILAHRGLFPSTHKDVDNYLKNNTFKWIGWDYINNHDIGAILKECLNRFQGELK